MIEDLKLNFLFTPRSLVFSKTATSYVLIFSFYYFLFPFLFLFSYYLDKETR